MLNILVQTTRRWGRLLLRMLLSRAALQATAVLLAAIALVAIVARTGKWVTVERLAAQIRTSDDSMAGLLVAELAAFGDTAYPALVVAANSNRSAVALAARSEIDNLVDEWQQQAYLHPATFDLGRHATPLAAALDEQLPEMTASGRRWARQVLSSLLVLAQQQRFRDRLELIRVCDQALSSLPPDEAPLQFESDVDYRLTLAPPPRESLFDRQIVDQPRSVDLPRTEDLPPAPVPSAPGALVLDEIPPPQPIAAESALSAWDPKWNATEIDRGTEAAPSPATVRVPAHSTSTRLAPPPMSLDDNRQELDVREVPHLGDRTEGVLFKLLATGDEEKQAAAAEALLVRGYGNATPLDARMLLSASIADRVALVDLTMTSTRLESRKWLWRLAHDASGEVRAAAVSAISTSGDRELIQATVKLALRDTDPRVAEQAAALTKMLK